MAGDNRKGVRSVDEITGRAKKAWGEATGDETTRRQGTVDKLAGRLKSRIDNVRERANEFLDRRNKK